LGTHIPFLAWTIIPYWSIDALCVVSLFLCTSRAGLDTHAHRLPISAGHCRRLLHRVPLKFAWPSRNERVSGFLFDALAADKPSNQAPSLHRAAGGPWDLYRKQVPRSWHWLLHGHFALIGVSVLTT
jgi:hypothetical protein